MNGEQLHLLLNHLPIVGSFFGFALVLLSVVRRADAGALHAATLVLGLSAVGAAGAYFTGEDAEEVIEHRPSFNHDAVEEHEEGAPYALGALVATAITSAGLSLLTVKGRPRPTAATVVWVLLSLLSVAILTRVGFTGRAVGHPDLYGPTLPAAP